MWQATAGEASMSADVVVIVLLLVFVVVVLVVGVKFA